MIDDEDNNPPVREDVVGEDIFQWILTQLCSAYYSGESELTNETQSFNLWLKIGEILNIPYILPYHKVVILGNDEGGDKPILSYVMTTNKEVLDNLLESIDESVVEKLAESVEERKKKYS